MCNGVIGQPAPCGQDTSGDCTIQPGFPFTLPVSPFLGGAVAVGDVDGDGIADIVIGGANGTVYVVTDVAGPALLWSYATGSTPVKAGAAIADVDGDGFNEVIVTAGSFDKVTYPKGGVYVISHTGNLVCSYVPSTGIVPLSVLSSPAIGNLDHNTANRQQIVFAELTGFVTAIDTAGITQGGACHVLWTHDGRETNSSSVALADLYGDGNLEVIVGGGTHAEGPPFNTPAGGMVQVLDHTGNPVSPWPHYLDEVVSSAPVIGWTTSGSSPDIFVGTGFCWSDIQKKCAGQYLGEVGKYLNAFDVGGNYLPRWPVLTSRQYAPEGGALAPLAPNSAPNIYFKVVLQDTIGTPGTKGRLYALHGDGSNVFAPVDPTVPTGPGTTGQPSLTPPIIADLLGLGAPQIIMGAGGNFEVLMFDSMGVQLTRQSCCPFDSPALSLQTRFQTSATPAIADIDGDGKLELIEASGTSSTSGALYAWKFPNSNAKSFVPWPTYRHSPTNTGIYDSLFVSDFE